MHISVPESISYYCPCIQTHTHAQTLKCHLLLFVFFKCLTLGKKQHFLVLDCSTVRAITSFFFLIKHYHLTILYVNAELINGIRPNMLFIMALVEISDLHSAWISKWKHLTKTTRELLRHLFVLERQNILKWIQQPVLQQSNSVLHNSWVLLVYGPGCSSKLLFAEANVTI